MATWWCNRTASERGMEMAMAMGTRTRGWVGGQRRTRPIKGRKARTRIRTNPESKDGNQTTTWTPKNGYDEDLVENQAWELARNTHVPKLEYEAPSEKETNATAAKLALSVPWKRVNRGSVLLMELAGTVAEIKPGRFAQTVSLPQICENLTKATYDPRIVGVYLKIDPLQCGWAKLQEIKRHVERFRQSGKFSVAFLTMGGEKEYYLASSCEEIYVPPSAYVGLRGLSVTGTFLRGALDKVGIEPQVQRIGKYKSAGDQLQRTSMSEAQKEALDALLNDLYANFVTSVAKNRSGKDEDQVKELVDSAVYEMAQLKDEGWITDIKYVDELEDMISQRTAGKGLNAVNYKRYSKVGSGAFGLRGRKRIAVIRTSGAITGQKPSGNGSGTIASQPVIEQIRRVKKDKSIAGVVLRVDSPGGDALASDLMWRELRLLSQEKPLVASMSDVAASGGYYMSMGCSKIVAEPLTITGSIGVVTAKFNLGELYQKIGYGKEVLSKGKFAEIQLDSRPFTEEEAKKFADSAMYAYESFRNKAALSRGMEPETMETFAQGRVWTGVRAIQNGLIDALGGLDVAVDLVKEMAGMEEDEKVSVMELSRSKVSPLSVVTGGASSAEILASLFSSMVGLPPPSMPLSSSGRPQARMEDIALSSSLDLGSTHWTGILPPFLLPPLEE